MSKSPTASLACLLTLLSAAPPLLAADQAPPDLLRLSLEELVNMEVTTVSKKPERIADAPAAVFVITQDDIRRLGIRSIPEALRLAPGMSALQIDGSRWSIGGRGISGRYNNKLLVMMDGRVLYSPSFSGVFWDVQDTMLEDIERIEVIRGPGATLWGANAVSGVINIITRKANVEPGTLASTRIEEDGSYLAALRHAGTIGASAWRGFLRHEESQANEFASGGHAHDAWNMTRVGVRGELTRDATTWTLLSDAYTGKSYQQTMVYAPVPPAYLQPQQDAFDLSGAFAIGRWEHRHSDSSDTTAQIVMDYTDRTALQYSEERQTLSGDLQHRQQVGRHDLVYGLSARSNSFKASGSVLLVLDSNKFHDSMVSVFVRDEIALHGDDLRLTLGARLEHNSYSTRDIEVMPTVRLLWSPADDIHMWGAVTRAVRTPSMAETLATVSGSIPTMAPGAPNNPFPLPLRSVIRATPGFKSETLLSYELGVRGRLNPKLGYDIAAYRMEYDKLRAIVPSGVVCNPSGLSPMTNPQCLLTSDSMIANYLMANGGKGHVKGGEVSMDWDALEHWRLRGSYAYAGTDIVLPTGPSPDTAPTHQFLLRSEWTLNRSLNFALMIRHVGGVELFRLPDYWKVDAQLNWLPAPGWQLGLGIRDAFRDKSVEYLSEFNELLPTRVEPSGFVQLRWTR